MIGFDAGFIPQLLCVGDRTPAALPGALCVMVVSLAVGVGLWQAREPRRVSAGRSMCLGSVLGVGLHAAVAVHLGLP
ncbi:hypothetical protein [Actinoplanes siamensis]|uniref:Uncharacterized protein n=1 Tax=Actinoplanes siamensis TaxID=1223317 RepID=A0A919N4S7_9ACTN|nr:hypothetical protein [Actinoplanes siamensis]GIF04272.1 hypothetical protein Asi03nite_18100 [Actinoplanes siamensis]